MHTKEDQPGQREATQGSGRQAQAHHVKNHPQEDKPGKRPKAHKDYQPNGKNKLRKTETGPQHQSTQRDESTGRGRQAQGTQRLSTQQEESQKGGARQVQGTQRLSPEWQGAS